MNHANEGTLQAYLDGEVTGAARHEIAEHLDACASCAAELEALRALSSRVGAALSAVDHPVAVPPALQAVRQRVATLPAARPVRGRSAAGGSFVRAAVLTLLVAGGASAAIPGSPVRQWLADAWDRVATFFAGERTDPLVVAPPESVSPAEASGLSVAPYQGRVTVSLTGADPAATIHVVLVSHATATVIATTPGARFGTARGRIEVSDVGSRDLIVRIPMSAASAIVELNGVMVASKNGDALVAHAPPLRLSQHELVFQP